MMALVGLAIFFNGRSIPSVHAAEKNQQLAFIMAAKLSGSLLPGEDLVERIAADLTLIKTTLPATRDISPRQPWIAGQLLVGFETGDRDKFVAGKMPEITAANEKYGPVTVKAYRGIEAAKLTFSKPFNPEVLAAVYTKIPGVKFAESNKLVGDGDRATVKKGEDGVLLYTLSKGWGDCQAGCIHRHTWNVSVTGGTATLISEKGPPVP